MTPQERDLITALINRLQQVGNQPKDADAEALIRQGVAALPDTPYLLVQTVLIQDMALSEAHNRITDLEKQLATTSAPPQQATSFLAGARGSVPATGPWAQPAPSSGSGTGTGSVWTQSGMGQAAAVAPAPPPMAPLATPGASSGFLRQAATTAAGIAGGALLFQGISSLFGPHYGGGFMGGMPAQPGLGETVVNNYYGNAPEAGERPTTEANWGGDPGTVQADNTDDSGQDFSSDSGGDSVDV